EVQHCERVDPRVDAGQHCESTSCAPVEGRRREVARVGRIGRQDVRKLIVLVHGTIVPNLGKARRWYEESPR
ncbi:MAG: hypothetical protein QOE43_889, partial [Gaiellaceae bacterium]|nr:hypothetical protein [Gaiellaceae bacterium]